MTDLPQHASQITLLRSMLQAGFGYASYFFINWFTPYLLGYLLVFALVPIAGIVTACKLVVSLALIAFPLSTALLASETGTDRRLALLSIPAMYGFCYQWGFLNFLVAAPLGLAFVWLTFRYARKATVARIFLLGIGINLLFFCHAMICVFFGLIAGLVILLHARTIKDALLHPLPLASVIPLGLFWASRTISNPIAQRSTLWDLNWLTTQDGYYAHLAAWTVNEGWGWGRTAGFFPRLLGERPGPLVTLFGLAIFLLPIAAGARVRWRGLAWVPFSICALVLLFAPGILFGTDFTFQRFTLFAAPLFVIMLRLPEGRGWPRWTWPAVLAVVASWMLIVCFNTLRYQRDAAGFEDVLARMEPNQRALSFAFEHDSQGTMAPPFLHFPSWYGAIKGGIVDPNIAGTHVQLVLFRPGYRPAASLWGFEWFPTMWDWRRFKGEQYRYFVARAPEDRGAWMFKDSPCRIQLLVHVNHWWLYERDPGCGVKPIPQS